jgi:hypothetical protein
MLVNCISLKQIDIGPDFYHFRFSKGYSGLSYMLVLKKENTLVDNTCFLTIASTHCDSAKSDLLIEDDSDFDINTSASTP